MMGLNCWTPDGRARFRFFSGAFSDCAVASFADRVATWLDSSEIVFVSSATNVLLAYVSVAIFASARVWSCCILVKSAAMTCAACTFAAYPSVFKFLDDLQVTLKARAKWVLKLLQIFSSLAFRCHSQQSSWYSPHFSMFPHSIEKIWAGEYGFFMATASWFHSIFQRNLQIGFRLK